MAAFTKSHGGAIFLCRVEEEGKKNEAKTEFIRPLEMKELGKTGCNGILPSSDASNSPWNEKNYVEMTGTSFENGGGAALN